MRVVVIPMLIAVGCSGASRPAASRAEPDESAATGAAEPGAGAGAAEDTGAAGHTAEAGAVAPPVEAPEAARPGVPRPAPGDPSATVLAELERGCTVRGFDGPSVYVQSAGLFRVPREGGAAELIHADPEQTGSYRVAHGRAVHVRHREHSLVFIDLVSLVDGTATLISDDARVSSWAPGPDGVYWGDNTYTEPQLFRVPYDGGERQPIETLRPVGNEDRIEQLAFRDGALYFVLARVEMNPGRGIGCDDLFGGRLSRSRNLRRGRACMASGDSLHVLRVGPRFVYYWREQAFRRVPIGGGSEQIVAEAPGLPQGLWSNDRVLLWQDWRGIVRLRLEPDATPELLAPEGRSLWGLDVADGYVYWTHRGDGEPCLVMRRPLDAPALGPAPDH